MGQGQMIEFALQSGDVQNGGDRGIDFHGFLSNALALGLFEIMQGAQIVQAVRQLDDHDPEAPAGAHENLAVGEVLEGGSIQVIAGQFGAAIHQFRDRFTEMPLRYRPVLTSWTSSTISCSRAAASSCGSLSLNSRSRISATAEGWLM